MVLYGDRFVSFRVFRQSYSMTEFLQGFNIFACHDPFNLTAEQSEIELINKMNANAFNLKGDASKLRYDWTVDSFPVVKCFRMVAFTVNLLIFLYILYKNFFSLYK